MAETGPCTQPPLKPCGRRERFFRLPEPPTNGNRPKIERDREPKKPTARGPRQAADPRPGPVPTANAPAAV